MSGWGAGVPRGVQVIALPLLATCLAAALRHPCPAPSLYPCCLLLTQSVLFFPIPGTACA